MEVSRVIFDELAARHSVVLPGVGSLEVRRRKAKKISETQIIPPQNVVVFSSDEEMEGAESVVALLASRADGSDMGAKSIYGSWFESARTPDGAILIERVGEIKNGRFIIAEPLHTALNPVKEDIIIMEKERNNQGSLWAWILVGVLAALLVFGVLWCYKNGVFDNLERGGGSNIETIVPVSEPAPDEIAADAVPPDGASSGDSAPAPVAAAPSEPRFHVIAGSFAVKGNAEKLMEKLKRNYPELTVEKVVNPRNGYEMVSIYQASSETGAYNKMNMYWDIDLYLWVYRQQ